jgi:putative transposase
MAEYRRKLPHFHPDDAWLFLTWRLWGSLPAANDSTVYRSAGYAFAARDGVLDRRASGPRWLQDPRIADLVAEAILIGDHDRHFY